MFRRPREKSSTSLEIALLPSVGRPPTPPSVSTRAAMAPATQIASMASSPLAPVLGRSQTTIRGAGAGRNSPMGKSKGKANGSILSFFKTVPKQDDGDIFFEDIRPTEGKSSPSQTPNLRYDSGEISPERATLRCNEDLRAVKRQRKDEGPIMAGSYGMGSITTTSTSINVIEDPKAALPPSQSVDVEEKSGISNEGIVAVQDSYTEEPEFAISPTKAYSSNRARNGPFDEDPETEDEMIAHLKKAALGFSTSSEKHIKDEQDGIQRPDEEPGTTSISNVPSLKREGTSIAAVDAFEGIDDFIDDEFPADGEEFLARLWMDDQERLEMGLEEEDDADEDAQLTPIESEHKPSTGMSIQEDDGAASCPICNASLGGITPEDASIHVNHCLDDNPIPLPKPTATIKPELLPTSGVVKSENVATSHGRFQRAAIARPGQANPFSFAEPSKGGSSAFSKLMSSHAEDTAWAAAAAAETASRGKPAFQRTCPFYKILPGFFICVDAFRYGAVEGCNAYFLSHFHSDHYIGLTSSWCHGPIYCSHVTANLVRRQLRVDPKWVIDLEFEKKTVIPGTQGVEVTMIPANHCPGSSLYLFEKIVGNGKTPKVHRVLHCGDFRACPAHVQHPLLRPDVVDAVTGKSAKHQKLDVCYLDTTYLTPKYAFPSQEEVIKACADMCVSLSKEIVDEQDNWEQVKKERAGSGMVKFVQKGVENVKEEANEDDIDAMKVNKKPGQKSRGRLLVIVGTYSIGKERICLGVARALNSKIYAPPNKQKICAALEDPELMARLTNDPLEAQVHMQMLMEIRAETLADYLTGYKPHFSRIVGFRPSGWNYRPPNSRFVESPLVQTVLHSENWKSRYSMAELVPQRGSTREASCFGVPYSEHSSFRELTMFCCALRIDKIIPTVNVGSAKSREKMKAWCEKWTMDKKKNGLFKVADDQVAW